jgi:hypothetical protein
VDRTPQALVPLVVAESRTGYNERERRRCLCWVQLVQLFCISHYLCGFRDPLKQVTNQDHNHPNLPAVPSHGVRVWATTSATTWPTSCHPTIYQVLATN